MTAKGAKYVALGALPPEKVTKGVRALTYNESVQKIEMHESTILHVAFKIRSLLNDFIDCLIL